MKAFSLNVCRNLPAKPEEEAQKHRQEYEEMVAQAKKRGDFLLMLVFLYVWTQCLIFILNNKNDNLSLSDKYL